MSVSVQEALPVALVVEDKPRALNRRREMLEGYGFHAIGATSIEEAVREFEATGAIDIVVTDIDLDPTKELDRSGVELAKKFKKARQGMPVVAYSSAFAEGDMAPSDWKIFDDHLSKGKASLDDIRKRLGKWHSLALDYRSRRLSIAVKELERIKSKYRILDKDLYRLREFIPGSHLPSSVAARLEDGGGVSAGDVLEKAGYYLRLHESGALRPTVLDRDEKTFATIPIWVRVEQEGTFSSELYGHSSIYEVGETEKEAVQRLLILMDGFHRDFCTEAEPPALSAELQRLKDFLLQVFGEV